MAPARAMSAPTASAAPTTTGSGWHEIVLQPAVTCEFVNGPSGAILTTANAAITTGRGRISSSWRLVSCPAPAPPPQPTPAPVTKKTCDVVLGKDKYQTNTTGILDLDCGPAMVVDEILFADFGLSDGSCAEGFTVNSSCSSSHSVDVVKTLCRDQQRCSILIGPKTFGGDPCLGVPKHLAVNVSCTAAAPTPSTPTPAPPAPPVYAPRHFEWHISVPVGSTAIVHVPLLGATAASVAVSADGGSAVLAFHCFLCSHRSCVQRELVGLAWTWTWTCLDRTWVSGTAHCPSPLRAPGR
jgi:hypothetical protein